MDVVEVWNSLFLYWLYNDSRAIWSLVYYQPGYLSYPDYRIFTAYTSTWVSTFLSASSVFLIAIRVAPSGSGTNFFTPGRNGPLRNTFPVLLRVKWFFIYSDQFLQNALYVSSEIWSLIRWRLLLNGFMSVLVNATDKPLRLICIYQGLGSARPNDLYNRFQSDLIRYKAAVSWQSFYRPISPSA